MLYGYSLLSEYLTVFQNHPNVNFEVQFSNDLIRELRPQYESKYYELLRDYLLLATSKMQNVKVVEGNGWKLLDPYDLCCALNVPDGSMKHFTPDNSVSYPAKYVVLNTKALSVNDRNLFEIWQGIKSNLFDIFNQSGCHVLLIGEKKHRACYEYDLHGTFGIYTDIISGGIRNLVDMTVDDITDLYTPELISRNIGLLSKSKFNIHIGDGGGIRLFSYTNSFIGLSSCQVPFTRFLTPKGFTLTTMQPQTFLQHIVLSL